MTEILCDLTKTGAAVKELEDAIQLLDDKILAKKTDLEKRDRICQKELEEKNKSLDELKSTSEKIVADIDEIITKLHGVL